MEINYKELDIDYGNRKFIKRVFKLAVPLLISSIIASLIAITDNLMIGVMQKSNSGELAATSLVGRYMAIGVVLIGSWFSMTNFLVNQYIGKKEIDKVKDTLKLQYVGSMIITAIMIIIAYTLSDHIMEAFQGSHYKGTSTRSLSTNNGLAQHYLKVSVWYLIPFTFVTIGYTMLATFKKQKVIVPLSLTLLFTNALLNYLLYEVAKIGIDGIMYSTIITNSVLAIVVFVMLFKWKDTRRMIFFPIKEIFKIDKNVFKLSMSRWTMGLQLLLFRAVLILVGIIYSRWYGDLANNSLAIIVPVAGLFYSALQGIAKTKYIFVGRKIGAGDTIKAYIYDKRLNMYTFVVAFVEGIMLIGFGFLIPLIWRNVDSEVHTSVKYAIIAIGITYPFAALTNTLNGSFKVAGMGHIIVLTNGIVAVVLELFIPLIMFIIYSNTTLLADFPFWGLYAIARGAKLFKFPLTYFYWRKLKWLKSSV